MSMKLPRLWLLTTSDILYSLKLKLKYFIKNLTNKLTYFFIYIKRLYCGDCYCGDCFGSYLLIGNIF